MDLTKIQAGENWRRLRKQPLKYVTHGTHAKRNQDASAENAIAANVEYRNAMRLLCSASSVSTLPIFIAWIPRSTEAKAKIPIGGQKWMSYPTNGTARIAR